MSIQLDLVNCSDSPEKSMDMEYLASHGREIKILIVDDDEDNLLVLQEQLLQLLNCTVISALDGKTGLALAKNFQPDIILLDIMMRELDGVEVVCQLRQDPQTQTTPVIAVTAMARIQDEEIALQAGCDEYLRKPYELEHLALLLERRLKIPCVI